VWHALNEADGKTLGVLAAEFRRAHPNLRVHVLAKGSALETTDTFFNTPAAKRPAVVMLPVTATRAAIDTGTVTPVADCFEAAANPLADFVPGSLAGAAVDGVQWGAPFGSSAAVLVYDKAAFRRAGLDPNRPPATLDDVTAASRALIASGATRHGLALTEGPSLFVAAGALGTDGAARSGAVARWLAEARTSGLATAVLSNTSAPGVNALATREAGMAIESTLALPDAAAALRQGQAPGIELGVAPVPTPSGAAVPFDSYSWFLGADASSRARNAGWAFVEWLSQPKQQARLAGGTDFLPASTAVTATEPIDRWSADPVLAHTWSVVATSPPGAPVPTGALQDHLIGLDIAFWSLFDHGASADDALADATARADVGESFYRRSPDHYARCAFARPACSGDIALYAVALDGTGEVAVGRSQSGDAPEWAPDGQRIAFSSGLLGAATGSLFVMNADGSHRLQITSGSMVDRHPAWSPDGTRIVFQRGTTGSGGDVYVINADGTGGPVRLTSGDAVDQQPTWSPDGRSIAYASDRAGGGDIWVMDADGSNARQLTNDRADDWWPTWSPDGSRLAFVSDRDVRTAVYVMNADGSNQHRLTGGGQFSPSWSPDGRWIAVIDGASGEVYLIASDGSSSRRLTTSHGSNFAPAWSPDGTRVIVSGARRG
jgi:TolB protein